MSRTFLHLLDVVEIDVPRSRRRSGDGCPVPARVPLSIVHEALQVAFGWKDHHLHDFRAGGVRFTIPRTEDEVFAADERGTPLGAVLPLVYTYDFGDDWQHEIALVRIAPDAPDAITCLAGARACPPEDCGGTIGYEHLLELPRRCRSRRASKHAHVGGTEVRPGEVRSRGGEQEARDALAPPSSRRVRARRSTSPRVSGRSRGRALSSREVSRGCSSIPDRRWSAGTSCRLGA